MHNPRLLPVVIALSLGLSACFSGKSPSVFTPPPPRPAAAPQVIANASLPSPPDIYFDPAGIQPPAIGTTMPEAPEPPKPAAPPRRAVAPPRATPPPSGPAQEQQPAPPRIVQVFTPDQKREYDRQLNDSLDRVRKVMAAISGKPLNTEQNEIADRIRTFEQQAEKAREQDLVAAVGLARRADVLAQDLLDRVR